MRYIKCVIVLLFVFSFNLSSQTLVRAGIYNTDDGDYEIRVQADNDGLLNFPQNILHSFIVTLKYDNTKYSPSFGEWAEPTGVYSPVANSYENPFGLAGTTYVQVSFAGNTFDHFVVQEAPGESVIVTFRDNDKTGVKLELMSDTDPFAGEPNALGIYSTYLYDAPTLLPKPNNNGYYRYVQLQLVEFHVAPREQDAILNWITSLEINASHFDIERSLDMQSWEKIAQVDAVGNSFKNGMYNYIDKDVYDQNSKLATFFYRLRCVAHDGSHKYSEIRSVSFRGADFSVHIYPNPASRLVTVEYTLFADYNDISIDLMDTQGRLIKSIDQSNGLRAGDYRREIDIDKFTSGVYYIRLASENDIKLIPIEIANK